MTNGLCGKVMRSPCVRCDVTMDDRLKESISALMDDESNEVELTCLLTHHDRTQFTGIWQRYHLVRSVLRNNGAGLLAIDISQRVARLIEQDSAE